MKELSIEEKAIAYDKAIERAKEWYNNPNSSDIGKSYLYAVFPELKDEDESIRKELIEFVKSRLAGFPQCDKYLTWIEKQGKQKPTNWLQELEDKLANATPKQLTEWKEKYFKEEPAYNVEPKFKKGDIIKEKETGNLFYVNSIEDFGYTLHYKNYIAKGCTMEFKYEDNYELAPSWGEDDEKIISDIYDCIKNLPIFYKTVKINGEYKAAKQFVYSVRNWLDSLEERVK